MDMNPFANNNQQTMSQTPDYLEQNPRANASVPGAVSNMVKAIMDGNNKFQQRAGMTGDGGAPGSAIAGASGPTSFGGSAGPMPLAPSPSAPNAPVAGAPTSLTAPLTNGGPDMGAAGGMQSIPSFEKTALMDNAGNSPMARGPNTFDSGASPVPFGWSPGIMAGGMGYGAPGMPNGVDRSMTALFSQIPGGGMFGG